MSGIRFLAVLLCLVVLPLCVSAQGAGVAPDGQKGQLHVVVEGDTLWDITATYLGTPWIWPSIWKENSEIKNPHRIYPGDLIWITEKSMRKVTPEEAAELMEQSGEISDPPEVPTAPDPTETDAEPEQPIEPDPFASLDQGETVDERVLKYPGLHRVGWVTADQFGGSAAVIGSHEEHYWSSQGQKTIVSLGEGQVNVGDVFSVYRIRRRVIHPDTGKVVGYFTENLGKLEVTEIHPEASFVNILVSYGEIQPGDRVAPYLEPPVEIREKEFEDHVKGVVIAQQPYRVFSGWSDFVILDRGSSHGVEPGNRFNLYRAGKEVRDPLTLTKVLVPDDVVGRAFVVTVTPTTSLALITSASRKIQEGDRFRDI